MRALGRASAFNATFSAPDVQRALRLIDSVVRWESDRRLADIVYLYGRWSNLGDECGARLVSYLSIPPLAFALQFDLAANIGPLTLRALLHAGATPNCGWEGRLPLYDVLKPLPQRCRDHRLRMAAILLAAGANPTGAYPDDELRDSFEQLCDLRSLSALYSCRKPTCDAAPAVRFSAKDGDLAIAHRVRTFLADRSLFTSQ
jgi:hypothetical protein